MNITTIKLASWIGSAALFGYLVWFIVDFKMAEKNRSVLTEGDIKGVLGAVEAPPPEKDELVAYADVRDHLGLLNWTGKVTRKEVPKGPDTDQPIVQAKKPVSELLDVVMIQYHSRGDRSTALVRYLDPTLVATPVDRTLLKVADTLPAPHDNVFVDAIEPEGVVFAFSDDEEREKETLRPAEFSDESLITKAPEGGAILPPKEESLIGKVPTAAPWSPRETTQIGKHKYRIGTEDTDYIAENWSEVLSRDIRDRRHRDPSTGKYDGIEITKVAPGSFAARHGVQDGDVLKSINGHPVTSKTEAINFVKNNDDVYDTWEVVIERLGRDVTMTYEEPGT